MRSPTSSPTRGGSRAARILILLCGALACGAAGDAAALLRIDFEQAYFRHVGRQVWDFSIVRDGDRFHIFYHTIPESAPSAVNGDTIWHASSDDLRHWTIGGPVVTVSNSGWKAGAVWAPDVFRDDVGARWVMAYTGCDSGMNQRIGLAVSPDLETWQDLGVPVAEPDTNLYDWSPTGSWSDFRDPFVYRADGQWHLLVTARRYLDVTAGVIYHATSADLLDWQDVGPLFAHDGAERWRPLESSQYHVIGQTHHLLFGEFDQPGVTVLSAADPADWTMADRRLLDYGYAPEIAEAEPGVRIYARLAPYTNLDGTLSYVVRMDTLTTAPDGTNLEVRRPHPLDRDFEVRTGGANLGNPVWGDNVAWRGGPPVGMIGSGWYGSQEYYQGPLSGRGAPGTYLGDGVTGRLESRPFTVEGNRMRLLVGGGYYPETCYVALVDTADGTILCSATGRGVETMSVRQWDLRPHRGRVCRIVISDQETGVMGHINVDEIVEEMAEPAQAAPAPQSAAAAPVRDLGAAPNPCNPATAIRFELDRARICAVTVHDVRGRLVWSSGGMSGAAGPNRVVWRGRTNDGGDAASGAYFYRIAAAGAPPVTGRITLVR